MAEHTYAVCHSCCHLCCHLCWVSICWMSICWMSLCWVSWCPFCSPRSRPFQKIGRSSEPPKAVRSKRFDGFWRQNSNLKKRAFLRKKSCRCCRFTVQRWKLKFEEFWKIFPFRIQPKIWSPSSFCLDSRVSLELLGQQNRHLSICLSLETSHCTCWLLSFDGSCLTFCWLLAIHKVYYTIILL